MSSASGSAQQVISLPQGGGAQRGIGETFQPDLQTGTGNFTVPIGLPSGRNGFQPQRSLVYSTGNGNGPSRRVPGLDVRFGRESRPDCDFPRVARGTAAKTSRSAQRAVGGVSRRGLAAG
jgi:hypothetical protein